MGYVHAKRGEMSENGPLFTAEVELCNKILNNDRTGLVEGFLNNSTKKGFYDPNPLDDNSPTAHFSHDNMTGLYSMATVFGFSGYISSFPVYKWNSRFWLHPRDLIFYSLLKGSFVAKLLLPVLFVMAMVSVKKPRQDTSGKCLWFVRFLTMKYSKCSITNVAGSIFFNAISKMLEKEHGPKPFEDVFSIYFKDKGHPIHARIEELYEKGLI